MPITLADGSIYRDHVTDALEAEKAGYVAKVVQCDRIIVDYLTLKGLGVQTSRPKPDDAKARPDADAEQPTPSLRGNRFVAPPEGPRMILLGILRAAGPKGVPRDALIAEAVRLVQSGARNPRGSVTDALRTLLMQGHAIMKGENVLLGTPIE